MENNESSKKKITYHPMLIDVGSLGKELSEEEFNSVWMVFDALPEETKDILTAPEISKRIESLQKDYAISDDLIEIIAAIIREYFVFKKGSLWLENALLAKLDRKDVSFVKEYIQKNIFTIKPAPKLPKEDEMVPSVRTVSLPLLDAIAKYQRLSEQTVTEDRIVVKGESSLVRGSLRNWLRHYRDAVGIRKHSTMERGQFLFQGENTRRLSATERERVSFILKSLDDGSPVSIDVDRQEVIFPVVEDRGNSVPATASNVAAPALETSFRPLEKFPAKAAPIRKALEWNAQERRESAPLEKHLEMPKKKASATEVAAPFGNIGQQSSREGTKPRAVGVSAPVYAPASAAALEAPRPSQGNMSFSSNHMLPHEKELAKENAPSKNSPVEQFSHANVSEVYRESGAISIIRPSANPSGFRGDAENESMALPESGSDVPRMVNLQSSGGRNSRGHV